MANIEFQALLFYKVYRGITFGKNLRGNNLAKVYLG